NQRAKVPQARRSHAGENAQCAQPNPGTGPVFPLYGDACVEFQQPLALHDNQVKRLSSEPEKPRCWIISDGAAGNARQAMAVARALELEPREVILRLRHPWDWLAPRWTWKAAQAMCDQQGHPVVPPWPDIAIGCGRKAALLTRCLRNWSSGRCFTVQILDPRVPPDLFDALLVRS